MQRILKKNIQKWNNLNINKYNSLENKLLVPQYQRKNNSDNRKENINIQNTNIRYFGIKNDDYYNNRYNKEINKNNS